MEHGKKILRKLLFPPLPLLLILAPIAFGTMIYTFMVPGVNEIMVYASYALSFYSLVILCIRIPDVIRRAKTLRQENRYIRRYTEDAHLRVKLSLFGSVSMNTLYAIMQLGSGLYYHSIWFYALASYYALLAIMRLSLLRDSLKGISGHDRLAELRRYRFCGWMLTVMNLALGVIVLYIVWQNRGFSYHPIHTIAMAAYTFTATTVAIINVIKYRRYDSPVLSAAKAISLAAALVSMLSLETAMISAFGADSSPLFRQRMTAISGGVVCMFVLLTGVYMILRASREIKATPHNSQLAP